MKVQEMVRAGLSQVPVEQRTREARKVDHDQAVDHVSEIGIHVEGQHLASDFQILAHQNRDAFAVGFKIGDHFGKLIDIGKQGAEQAGIAGA